MADETTPHAQAQRPDAWDLLPGYALEALDESERHEVERLLESDGAARRALDEYRDVVASFTVEAQPPAHVRANVLERVRSAPQAGLPDAPPAQEAGGSRQRPTGPASPAARPDGVPEPGGQGVVDLAARRRRRRGWGVAAASVAAAAAFAVPTTIAVQLAAERDRLQDQVQTVSEMLSDPGASILRSPVEGGGEASVLVAGDDMYFRADGLPAPDPGRAYQLWVVQADGSVSSAGVLTVRGGEAMSLVRGSGGVGMAVSVEPEQGSEQPTTTPIVVLGA
ncbi:anti-sigma factor [Myceligenerans indicum]|uniref:Regulator of SigK n=1 Tax=Myceligenerans indicum TaxID=2593663 RepID=A0ABS1LN58_9MICO|nr:anti-sigma factor [Myceligenerans indicum]MBL0887454.1 anti-sigma factor [Myceligenerans indicum]